MKSLQLFFPPERSNFITTLLSSPTVSPKEKEATDLKHAPLRLPPPSPPLPFELQTSHPGRHVPHACHPGVEALHLCLSAVPTLSTTKLTSWGSAKLAREQLVPFLCFLRTKQGVRLEICIYIFQPRSLPDLSTEGRHWLTLRRG